MKLTGLCVTACAALLFTGCATLGDTSPPLTIDTLLTRAKAGESNTSLLASLRASSERFTLTGSELAALKERGMPDALLDELQKRQIADARDDEWRRAQQLNWRLQGWPYYGLHRPIIVVPAPIKPKSSGS